MLFPGSIGGSFGIRPLSHKCFGLVLSSHTANRLLPKGNVKFNLFWKKYEYRVGKDWSKAYCLGQDIWYGE